MVDLKASTDGRAPHPGKQPRYRMPGMNPDVVLSNLLALVACALLGYLTGSISSAILVARVRGLPDPRTLGSGNPGATNMLRHAGRGVAATVLVLDLIKGLLPTLAVHLISGDSVLAMGCAAGACLGHMWPAYFSFRGGKAVATYAGATFGLSVWLGLGFALVWLGVLRASKVSSLGALAACFSTPLLAVGLDLPPAICWGCGLVSLLVIARHHGNIRRLLAGDEGRVGDGR